MKHIAQWIGPIIITGTIIASGIINYTPGTYLSGWDNLQSDLYPSLAITRAWHSVWQEYQSFGLLAGMAHGADLIRAIYVWLLSLVIPPSLIRYVFTWTMVWIGMLGMYVLLKKTFSKHRYMYALVGSIWYGFNFGTIQIMHIPFDPFTVFFAALPWEVWIFFRCITNHNSTANVRYGLWGIFIGIHILAVPQAYAQQVFAAYLVLLGALTLGTGIQYKTLSIFKNALIALILILVINAHWIIPQVYFLDTSSHVIQAAKMNQMQTEQVIYQNLEKGNISDFFMMQGLFYSVYDKHMEPLFTLWQSHRSINYIIIFIFVTVAFVLLGLLRKTKYQYAFIFSYILVATALLMNTLPFSWINATVRDNIPIINQIFRSPFTKFIIIYAFVTSYAYPQGLFILASDTTWIIKRIKSIHTYIHVIIAALGIALILFIALPVWTNKAYLADEMRVSIPQDYIDIIAYMKNKDKNKRIALLPDYTYWGWFQHAWGYNGSGFMWYGIEQPIISRTFDVWSLESESYFWEMKTAIESENIDHVHNVVDKYNISYILVDTSVRPIGATSRTVAASPIDDVLEQSPYLEHVYNGDNITLYAYDDQQLSSSFVSSAHNIPNIGPDVSLTTDDTAYHTHNTYKTDYDNPFDRYFPYLDLTTKTDVYNKQWELDMTQEGFIIKTHLPPVLTDQYVETTRSGSYDIEVYADNKLATVSSAFTQDVHDNMLTTTVKTPLLKNIPSSYYTPQNCSPLGSIVVEEHEEAITIKGSDGAWPCLVYTQNASLSQQHGYITKHDTSNQEGRSFVLNIMDNTNGHQIVETSTEKMPLTLIPPKTSDGIGYSFVYQAQSYHDIPSINTLHRTDIYPFPYTSLKNLHFAPKDDRDVPRAQFDDAFTATKHNYYTYSVDVQDPQDDSTIILWQSYHQGWQAYYTDGSIWQRWIPMLGGTQLNNHYPINNWANGWSVDPAYYDDDMQPTIVLIFWPQYLQYVGVALLGGMMGVFLILLIRSRAQKKYRSTAFM